MKDSLRFGAILVHLTQYHKLVFRLCKGICFMIKKELNIAMLVLCAIGVGANIASILNMSIPLFAKIPLILAIMSFLKAFNYYKEGFKKEGAIHYYQYLDSLTKMLLAQTTVSAIQVNGAPSGFLTFAGILQYGGVLLLFESRDLGRVKSIRYASIASGLGIITFLTNIYLNPSLTTVISNIGFMILGFIVYAMTYAKYEDKKERNRNLEIHADQAVLTKKQKRKKVHEMEEKKILNDEGLEGIVGGSYTGMAFVHCDYPGCQWLTSYRENNTTAFESALTTLRYHKAKAHPQQ